MQPDDPTPPETDPARAPGTTRALDHLALLARAQAAFTAELGPADAEAPVPACAPWRVADLALHLTGVHRWAAACAVGLASPDDDPTGPRDTAALARAYGWAAVHLRDTLAWAGDAPALTLDGPGPASFWRRRQLHETLVHLVDLRVASGAAPLAAARDVPVEAWADTVDEVVTVMHPRQVRLGRAAPTRPVGLAATDTGGRWTLGVGRADVVVRGPAWALALLVWGRVRVADAPLAVTGDAAALDTALATALVP